MIPRGQFCCGDGGRGGSGKSTAAGIAGGGWIRRAEASVRLETGPRSAILPEDKLAQVRGEGDRVLSSSRIN